MECQDEVGAGRILRHLFGVRYHGDRAWVKRTGDMDVSRQGCKEASGMALPDLRLGKGNVVLRPADGTPEVSGAPIRPPLDQRESGCVEQGGRVEHGVEGNGQA